MLWALSKLWAASWRKDVSEYINILQILQIFKIGHDFSGSRVCYLIRVSRRYFVYLIMFILLKLLI